MFCKHSWHKASKVRFCKLPIFSFHNYHFKEYLVLALFVLCSLLPQVLATYLTRSHPIFSPDLGTKNTCQCQCQRQEKKRKESWQYCSAFTSTNKKTKWRRVEHQSIFFSAKLKQNTIFTHFSTLKLSKFFVAEVLFSILI